MAAPAAAMAAAITAGACTVPTTLQADDGRLQVVTTTGILRDLVANVGGEVVQVSSLIPDGADPHSYEPSLRQIRNVVYADVGFSNYALLEPHAVIKALDSNLPDDAANVSLAEGAVKYAAEIIQLVEDVSLDTIWLGMRVRGTGAEHGATRVSEVRLSATGLEGPGDLAAYLTESFGQPVFYVRSSDGFDRSDGYRGDTARLPPDAHTHMSWAFTEPGVYRLSMRGSLAVAPEERPIRLGEATFTFAVGVDPHLVPGMDVEHVLDGGHADITVDLDDGTLHLIADEHGADEHGAGEHAQRRFDPATTVIDVPNKALHEVPGDPAFRFLGRPGDRIHQLPQAVLGKHVHGEIDPHLWQDVGNAMSYVELIRDTLTEADPQHAATYRRNAQDYLRTLETLDHEVRTTIAGIPRSRRLLITTHDAFGYLGAAYDVEISGFVAPNPSAEPSLEDRRRLTDTIRNLDIPAVFLEPNLERRSSTLVEVAEDNDVEVCPIYGDAFDDEVTTYVELIRFNARSLARCLDPHPETP